MGSKMAATSLHWSSQPSLPHSPSSSRAVAHRRFVAGDGISGAGALICKYNELSPLFLNVRQFSNPRNIRRALSASVEDGRLETADGDAESPRPFDLLETASSFPANIEWKANSVDIPLSLRMIKRKKQWEEGFVETGESTYCSVKKAFSSMVFIIRELYSFTLQMREALLYEDLRGILDRVQKEMHASFVWLFQKVFSQTPTLMVHVMILLANYSVYSMSTNAAIAVTAVQPLATAEEEVRNRVVEDRSSQKFDSSIIRTLNLGKAAAASVGGNIGGGGGGKYTPVSSGTDGNGSNFRPTICPNGVSSNHSRDESMEDDDHSDQLRTEMQYQIQLAQDPDNPLLLANYAQFLYLVAKDYDRAEHHFKQAANAEPKDGEALNKYANFLWVVRNDLWAAEETYLEAIAAEPSNLYYAASYAHFLWNTGGEDTCFLLDEEATQEDL